MKKIRFIAVAVALLALGYFLRDAVDFLANLEDGKVELCTIPTPIYDAEIAIFTDSFQEVSQSLYYEIHTGGETRVPMAFFGGTAIGDKINQDSFTLIGEKDLLGVAFASDPKAVLIMHDFATDETWPKAGYSEHFSATHQRGERLIQRLREETSTKDLKLGDT